MRLSNNFQFYWKLLGKRISQYESPGKAVLWFAGDEARTLKLSGVQPQVRACRPSQQRPLRVPCFEWSCFHVSFTNTIAWLESCSCWYFGRRFFRKESLKRTIGWRTLIKHLLIRISRQCIHSLICLNGSISFTVL